MKIIEFKKHPSVKEYRPFHLKIIESNFGKKYKKYLKKNKYIHKLLVNILDICIYLKIKLTFYWKVKISKQKNNILKLSEYIEINKIKKEIVFDPEISVLKTPEFNTKENLIFSNTANRIIKFPLIYITKINNALVSGRTNFINCLDSKVVITKDLYDIDDDFTSEEEHQHCVIDTKNRKIILMKNDNFPQFLEEGVTFLDACAPNYAHWLTEILPRILIFYGEKKNCNIPMIINAELHKNLIESIQLVVNQNQTIILLPQDRSIKVNKLHLVSCCGYVPYGFRNNNLPRKNQGIYHFKAINNLTQHLSLNLEKFLNSPKRIYIKRNSDGKNLINKNQIEQILKNNGFIFIEPEKISFKSQFNYFKSANIIIATSGAAMANMIFCEPGTKIGILIGKSLRVSYGYWQNFASLRDLNLYYLLGKITNKTEKNNHPDFEISEDEFESFLNKLLS